MQDGISQLQVAVFVVKGTNVRNLESKGDQNIREHEVTVCILLKSADVSNIIQGPEELMSLLGSGVKCSFSGAVISCPVSYGRV
jgi:hypothetical protein